ncbi:hypothetical protein KJ973_00110 [Patescibacteria group bacterium]|nr:hypothetical protein [Patescibacteria group bacterium]MBU1519092.1 hypothetical protein [Patescibacteria group bacterium]MBU2416850.1 hypothetical protein [Patescibacteria group bacterium]MBU2461129.1 hypothetical protein [Patescibacteria group bacterium]
MPPRLAGRAGKSIGSRAKISSPKTPPFFARSPKNFCGYLTIKFDRYVLREYTLTMVRKIVKFATTTTTTTAVPAVG